MIAAVLAGLLAAGALLLWASPGAFGLRSHGPGRRRRAADGSAPRRARPGPGDHSFPALPAAALVELTACQLDAGLPLAEAVGVLADSCAGRSYPALSRAAAALRLGLSWETAWPHEKTLPQEIHDYRDATGRMRHTSPMTFQRFVGSVDDRRRYWARSHLGWPRIAAAMPNAGHVAVADPAKPGTQPPCLPGGQARFREGPRAAVGQFDVRVTPLQVAMVSAAVANDGVLMRPQLVRTVRGPDLQVVEDVQPEELGAHACAR